MTYRQLIDFLGSEIISVDGTLPEDFELHLADAAHVDAHTLDWDVKTGQLKVFAPDGEVTVHVKDAKRAVALVGDAFFAQRASGVHPTAIIETGAVIGKNCYIGPYVVIRSCVTIGDFTRVEAGAVIGNEGFGFVRKEDGDWIRFPQLGRVLIGDHVEIGANATIDRGALSDTVIGRDVKINESVHIAHNVTIGEHTVITANVNVSGSSMIGKNVWIAPGAILRDHSQIGDGALVGMGSVVTKPIPANEVWCGNPARKLKDR